MSKQELVTRSEIILSKGDLGDSIPVSEANSGVAKPLSKSSLRSLSIIKKAKAKAAKIVSSAKKKAASIAEKSRLRSLLFAEKREKKAKLQTLKVKESAEKHKAAYRVENWKSYNESLKARGEITLYLSPEVLRDLKNMSKKVVGERQYSDSIIEMCLSVHFIYGLALRQTQGFVESLLKLMGCKAVKVPNYSTICRRQGGLLVNISRRFEETEQNAIHMALDSTGLKVYGEGEWKVRQHGCSKRRTWMKLHIAIDVKTQEIIEVKLTDNTVHDADAAMEMVDGKVEKLASFRGDGAYDKLKLREKLGSKVIQIIPPPENAVVQKSSASKPLPAYLEQRNTAVETLQTQEREKWKDDIGYHQRSLNETVMFRYKNAFGGRLQARKLENQVTETLLKCKILNLFWLTGMPNATKVV